MTSRQRFCFGPALSLALFVIAGCGARATPSVEVEGTVSLNGVPVPRAEVMLTAKAADRAKIGTYSAAVVDGVFKFPKRQGPPPGEYELIVHPAEEDSEEVFNQIREKKRKATETRDQFLAAVARKGEIRVKLAADRGNTITVELTSK